MTKLSRLTGDTVMLTTVIELAGSTSLVAVGTKFFLDSISTGSDPSLKYGGADVVAGQFGGWTPIGAEQTASGYQVAWKLPGADQYMVWTPIAAATTSQERLMSGASTALRSFETSFHQDLNGDGAIGVPGTVIKSAGSTSLVAVGSKFFLDSISTGSDPSLKFGGADVVAGQFGGWTPIGAEQTATAIRWPGNSRAPINIWSGIPIAAATTSQRLYVGSKYGAAIVRDQFPSGLERRRSDRRSRDGDRVGRLDQPGGGGDQVFSR